MTKDQYLKFKAYEKQIKSGFHSGFARFSAPELAGFSDAVKDWRGNALSNGEKTCSRCLLKVLKAVAEEYERYEASPKGKALLKKLEEGNEGEE